MTHSALGVLKDYYITKRICKLLISNSRFLIQNLLHQVLFLFVADIVETLDLNN